MNLTPLMSPEPVILDVLDELIAFINFTIAPTKRRFTLLDLELYDSTTFKKVFYHLILADTLHFMKMSVLKAFVSKFEDHYSNVCPSAFVGGRFKFDLSVYRRNSNFRSTFASKYGQKNYLLPVPILTINLYNYVRGVVRIFPSESRRFSVLISSPPATSLRPSPCAYKVN